MAGLITVRLHRNDAQPWGFRLQGGTDFGTPLLIQKVNGGSLAEKAGLQVADAVIKVNGQDVYSLRHKDAQDSIVRAGNNMEIVVSRSPGGTWKPSVTPVGNIPSPSPVGGAPSPVTKTSLAYKGPPAPAIPGYNTAAKPFSPQLNGVGVDPAQVRSITSKQYNNPVGLYSDQAIAETLSAQAEVLAGGALGVNFMKNEKTKFDASHSEVLKMVQEIDAEPRTPEPVEPTTPAGVVVPPPVSVLGAGAGVSGMKHVAAPENKPPSTTPGSQAPLQPGQNICADCERLIVGVFVRIKDKNLHVDCFKCATCGTSLKNVGYYNINNKLYCDIHAKLVARANPPAPNLDPVTIPPGGQIPSGLISSPLAPTSPQPGTMAPLPFHAPRLKPSHVNPPRSFKPPPSNAAPPKPFAPPPAPASFSAPAAPPPFAPAPSVTSPPAKPFSSVQFNPPAPAPAPAPTFAPAQAPFAPAPAPPSSFPKTLPGQIPSKPLGKKGPGGAKSASTAGTSAPRRGRGVLNAAVGAGARIPLCGSCNNQIRGPFITALGKIWCPDHFVCVNAQCRRPLQDIGFVEEEQGLYCEYCFEQYLAPACNKCNAKIKGDCLNAIGKHFHPECFTCAYCGKLFGNNPFFLEDALPYCEADWNELFTTKCFSCGFPIEAGDRWVEALNNNYHSQCFSCTACKKNLEGQSFFAKGGRPFCKNHAR